MSTIDAIQLTIERSRLLNANQRHAHPSAAWGKAKVLRNLAKIAALRFPRQEPSLVIVTMHFPDASTRRDAANWHPSLKPLIDGIVDAGVLPDDSTSYLQGPLPVVGDVDPTLRARWGQKTRKSVRLVIAFHPMHNFSGDVVIREERVLR